MTITRTISIVAICIGLSASACATGTNSSALDTSRQQAAVSLDPQNWLYLESCDACEQGVPQRTATADQSK